MKTISILGAGWLGLPLAQHFVSLGYQVKASTTSENRIDELARAGADAFIVDILNLTDDVQRFLDSNILIVNITSKELLAYQEFIRCINASKIENVLYVSSTSVYENTNLDATERDGNLSDTSVIRTIEDLFKSSNGFKTTILRLAGLIGPKRHPGRFFRAGKMVRYPESPVNLIHRDDCIGIIDKIIELAAWGEIFNGCADTHPSKREFYSFAAGMIQQDIPVFANDNDQLFKLVRNEKVKQELQYSFKHPDLMKIDFSEYV